MNSSEKNQYLEHQTREFADSAGRRWLARIEQGGGRTQTDAPPVARLIFSSPDDPQAEEIATSGDADNWDLSSYSEGALRRLLTQAQARAALAPSD